MPTQLGAHNARLARVRELLSKKGRREQGRFTFEGPTLLADARAAGIPIEEVFATESAYEASAAAKELDAGGVPVYLVDERALRRISDVESPSGLVAVTSQRLELPEALLSEPGLVLGLADIGDPGNAGTLLRSAEAFGAGRVIVGSSGVEPHHPKVIRAAMGATFRLRLAAATPDVLRLVLDGWQVTGLAAHGTPIEQLSWAPRSVLVVGNERHGLGSWEPLCERLAALPMRGAAESLNAAIAGSIALYEASKGVNS